MRTSSSMVRKTWMLCCLCLSIGCSQRAANEKDSEAVEEEHSGETAQREEPIEQTQVLIVGAGASGLAAAVSAANAGAEVLVLEREALTGGAGHHASHFWAAGTSIQAELGIEDDPETALAEWPEFTGGSAEGVWVEAFVTGSANTLEWLMEFGVPFAPEVRIMDNTGTRRRIHVSEMSATGFLEPLVSDQIRLNTEVTGLVVENDRVVGVETDSGWYAGDVVVLATGGFSRQVERVEAAIPEIAALKWYMEAWPGMTGSGQDIVESVGVELKNPERMGLFGHGIADANLGSPEVMIHDTLDGMQIDPRGERVAQLPSGEEGWYHINNGPIWLILDDSQRAEMSVEGRGFNYSGLEFLSEEGLEGRISMQTYVELTDLQLWEDLESLAAEYGFSGLVSAVTRWNEIIASGMDPDFNESMEFRTAIDQPPYLALPLVVSTGKSFGGAPIDDAARVLRPDGSPVPGLYSAGELVGFLGGVDLGYGFNGSVTACYFVGREAGASAAAEAMGGIR